MPVSQAGLLNMTCIEKTDSSLATTVDVLGSRLFILSPRETFNGNETFSFRPHSLLTALV